MKTRFWSFFKLVLLLLGGLFLCIGLLYFMDVLMNGVFLDWFSQHFMLATQYYDEAGTPFLVYQPLWSAIKQFVFLAGSANIVFWIGLIWLISRSYAKRRVKKALDQSISMTALAIQDYMQTELPASRIFPKEYSEISSQIVEIKSTMQRHDQILKEESQRKNDLITYLAHDLKTPLTSIIGYLSLLNEAPDMPMEQKAKYVSITLDKARRLEQLINEFFEITRYNLQEIILEKELVDLTYMLVQMADEFYPILSAHKNTIELSIPENLSAEVDPIKLARVFNNILKNAVAYSYEGTPIQLSAWETSSEIHITFRNQGKTIPEQKLKTIFEKFFRLDEARATNTGGAGLGLAIAREIVTLHGGTILAESKDGWTSFLVVLPKPTPFMQAPGY